MLKQIRPAILMIVLFTIITGLAYPLGMTGLAPNAVPAPGQWQPDRKDGKVIGSELIGQNFASAKYFHGRLSATSEPIPRTRPRPSPCPMPPTIPSAPIWARPRRRWSSASRPTPPTLHAENPCAPVPVDLVTSSASGLDPDITPGGGLVPGAPRGQGARAVRGGRAPAGRKPYRGPRFSA